MSGSYDRPGGPRALQPAAARLEHDAFHGATTGASTQTSGRTRPPPKLESGAEPPGRSRRADPGQTTAPIVPAGSVTGRSLTLVITIMCFLACLTAGAVYMMNQSANAWPRWG